jgi:hypothetical protein
MFLNFEMFDGDTTELGIYIMSIERDDERGGKVDGRWWGCRKI